jgi:hypothetical protein
MPHRDDWDGYNCAMLVGVMLLGGCNGIDPGQIIDEAGEIIDQLPTPSPGETPTPTPTATPGTSHSEPVYYTAQPNSELPVGVCVATENYVGGLQDRGSSIAVDSITLARHFNPVIKVKKDYTQVYLFSPVDKVPGCNNWNTSVGYAYTSRYATNPDTGVIINADGTSRGLAFLGHDRPGLWDIYVKARCTENRGTAWIGVTVTAADGTHTTYWHKWYQRGNGDHAEVLIGKKVRFKSKEK